MDHRDSEFNKRIRQTFRIEAEEHLRIVTSLLIELEKFPDAEKKGECIENLFREVHSLKGASRSVDLRTIESICQPLETVISRIKRKEVSLEPSLFSLLHRTIDFLTQQVSSLEEGKKGKEEREYINKLINQLKGSALAVESPSEILVPKEESIEPISIEAHKSTREDDLRKTVRIPVSKLEPLLLQAEELIQTKVTTQQRVRELQDVKNSFSSIDGAVRETYEAKITSVTQAAEQDLRALRRIVDEHLETVKQILMLPMSTLTDILPKILRDLSHNQGKEIVLTLSGTEIEIDKRILEELKDPFIHLMRNCADHGIEKPEQRIVQQKSPTGKISMTFSTIDSRQMEISISDDGAGIDSNHILEVAVKKGLVTQDGAKKLNEKELLSLVFQSGFTTSPIITDISGRGLGLAIVREKVEKLGGVISVETIAGKGTTFRILIPLSLATFRGVLIDSHGHRFIIPTINVERVVRVKPEDVKTVENRETILIQGSILPLVNLGDMLGLPEPPHLGISIEPESANNLQIVILTGCEKKIAFKVEEIIEELQVLVKSLGKQLGRICNISGASILGNGKVIPVLNVFDLIKSAQHYSSTRKCLPQTKEAKLVRKILVADDSITSRTLLKTILESEGFQVTTAVDGVDAFAQVRESEFDLVVSDVDMPRMSGFELTAKIRADKKNSELPLILVTALDSRDDREHGIDVGANAYIVKSNFDQSNLIEVVNKLI